MAPIGAIESVVPRVPNDPVALLDARVAFFPHFFADCPSLSEVAGSLGKKTGLDFDTGVSDIPSAWFRLRGEARPYFDRLHIFEARPTPVVLDLSGIQR
jgi:hypothetical protein